MQDHATTSPSCAIRECAQRSRKLGLCPTHYNRFRNGRPLDTPLQRQVRGTLDVRIAAWSHRDPDGCLIWDGDTMTSGYGRISYAGRHWSVHDLTYRLAYGDDALPDGWDIDHVVCRKKLCIEPEHLRALPKRSHTRRHNATQQHGPDGRFLPHDLIQTSPVSTSIYESNGAPISLVGGPCPDSTDTPSVPS